MEFVTDAVDFIKDVNWAISLFAAIPLAIVANLLTPKVANWLSSRSEEKTKARIEELEKELNETHSLISNPERLGYRNFIALFKVLALIALGNAVDFLGVFSSPIAAGVYLSAIMLASKHVQLLRRCQDFTSYENETTSTIESLLEASNKQR